MKRIIACHFHENHRQKLTERKWRALCTVMNLPRCIVAIMIIYIFWYMIYTCLIFMVCILLKISAKKILLRILNDRTDLRESWAFYAVWSLQNAKFLDICMVVGRLDFNCENKITKILNTCPINNKSIGDPILTDFRKTIRALYYFAPRLLVFSKSEHSFTYGFYIKVRRNPKWFSDEIE